jgi:hypothetical protein
MRERKTKVNSIGWSRDGYLNFNFTSFLSIQSQILFKVNIFAAYNLFCGAFVMLYLLDIEEAKLMTGV